MEITNKVLVMLLVGTLAITVFGTMTSLNRIAGLESLTGGWGSGSSTLGSVNLTIQQNVNINFTQDRSNFGSGYVTPGSSACILGTSQANVGCTDFTNGTGVLPLLLENQGNANVRLNLTNINNSQSFIGGTNPGYEWFWNVTEGGGANLTCTPPNQTMLKDSTWINITTAYTQGVNSSLCLMFNATDTNDVINISFRLLIPADAVGYSAARSDTWTATAIAV